LSDWWFVGSAGIYTFIAAMMAMLEEVVTSGRGRLDWLIG
jgi:hypothetical protein